jgi:hypothetical protein
MQLIDARILFERQDEPLAMSHLKHTNICDRQNRHSKDLSARSTADKNPEVR